jgi:hypothetical protein
VKRGKNGKIRRQKEKDNGKDKDMGKGRGGGAKKGMNFRRKE